MDTYLPPNKFLSIRTIAMPAEANPHGDIAAGWIFSQMDLAALSVASHQASGRVTTASIGGLHFNQPVFIGDEVSFYAEMKRISQTTMTVKVDVWVKRKQTDEIICVAEGNFDLMSVDHNYAPKPIPTKYHHAKESLFKNM
jgi:acyl-CoA thioesterase YciA